MLFDFVVVVLLGVMLSCVIVGVLLFVVMVLVLFVLVVVYCLLGWVCVWLLKFDWFIVGCECEVYCEGCFD